MKKKSYEPLTDTIEDFSRDVSKTMTETSIKNNEVLENFERQTFGNNV